MHLCTPIALGNHDNENSDRVLARMVRRALDHAGVIYCYSWGDRPEGLHYMRCMFPLTPEELRPGMLLAKERILTNRSGRYGWLDGSRADVYVFDANGKLVTQPCTRELRSGRGYLSEVRMPSDHFAVIVRRSIR